MINFLGKFLVFLHTFISLVAMTWAVGLFLQFTDWGWKEPRQELDTRIPSEYDKSAASLKLAVRARDLVLPSVKPAQDLLADAEAQYPKNHLFYVQELEKLRGEPLARARAKETDSHPSFVPPAETIEAKEIKGPGLPLDTGKITGKPILDAKIDGIEKPLVKYRQELGAVRDEVVKVEKAIEGVLEETKKVTYLLTGMDDEGKKITIGLYDLVDAEYKALTQARHEFEEIKPVWAQTLEEARLYTLRRLELERTLARLKEAAAKR